MKDQDIRQMKDQAANDFARNFSSVIIGVISSIVVGALLYPVACSLAGRAIDVYLFTNPPPNVWKDDLLFGVIVFGWLFIASLAGGIVCTLFSPGSEITHVVISSLVTIVLIFIVSGGAVLKNLLPSLLILLSIPIGNLSGVWIGGLFKRKRKASN